MSTKIQVEHLFKIFGNSPEEALKRFQAGVPSEEIFRETGNVVAVADVSLSVKEGEVFMVMGLSGSGKSTLIRCINRLLPATSGHVYIDGEDILAVSDERLREIRRTKLAMVFQHFGLFPHRTVAENAEYGLKVRGVTADERRKKALETLDMVGLREWADRSINDLSGGMRQRVGLARALATDPDILLMDEAFSALDPLIRRDMQEELLKLQGKVHKTILFITHDLHEALKVGDRIAVLKDGRIVQTGTAEEIVSNPVDGYVQAFTVDVNRGVVFTAESIMKKAEPLLLGDTSIHMALYRLRHLGRGQVYVVNSQGKPVGLVVEQDIVKALQEAAQDLAHVMRTDFPQTLESAALVDILPLCSAGVPIAVVDDNGRLRGVLDPLDVLISMRRGDSTFPANSDQATEHTPEDGMEKTTLSS